MRPKVGLVYCFGLGSMFIYLYSISINYNRLKKQGSPWPTYVWLVCLSPSYSVNKCVALLFCGRNCRQASKIKLIVINCWLFLHQPFVPFELTGILIVVCRAKILVPNVYRHKLIDISPSKSQNLKM